ncbi:hypothetical protein ACOME3_002165 [Neoechinorhynchus agilis]
MQTSTDLVQPEIPHGTRVLEHQVAGHFFGASKTLFGALQDTNGRIVLKSLNASPNAPKEHFFYEQLMLKKMTHRDYDQLLSLTPRYLGLFQPKNQSGIQYLKLENLCNGFRKPCIKDVKIGRLTFDLDADEKKMRREIEKCPLALQIGFQFVGMKVFTQETYVYHERRCCRAMTIDQIVHGMAYFYQSHLNRLGGGCGSQRSFKMFGVSMLIIYEGFEFANDNMVPMVRVRLIDFAHVYIGEHDAVDNNFLIGIVNYRLYLETLSSVRYVYETSGHLQECEKNALDCYKK